ncbi:MAG: LytTR family DNA-binding domain-containing protein [Emticicia sp.]|nr:LytTR family DNA-binding domain-containing protein [Emticicia sp.]
METTNFLNNIIHVGGRKKLPAQDIVNMEADVNYTIIKLSCGKKLIVATTLKKLEAKLNEHKNFVRVNKSAILNMDYAKLEGNTFILPDKTIVEFSRRKFKKFQEKNVAA